MNLLDIVLAVILLFAAYKGFQRGFLLEVIAVAAFVLAVLGGFKLLHWGMELLGQYFNLHGEILPYVSLIVTKELFNTQEQMLLYIKSEIKS